MTASVVEIRHRENRAQDTYENTYTPYTARGVALFYREERAAAERNADTVTVYFLPWRGSVLTDAGGKRADPSVVTCGDRVLVDGRERRIVSVCRRGEGLCAQYCWRAG